MGIEAHLPTLITVIVTASIDSINPCAIGVLILMISVILTSGGTTKKMLGLGFLYIFAVFATYLAAGIGLAYYFASVPLFVAEYISIVVGVFIAFAGLVEIKDFFWYGRWFSLSIPYAASKKLEKYAEKTTIWGVMLMGMFVSAVELPCTGAPYLAIITVLSQYFDFTAFLPLVLYNLIFISPSVVILLLVAGGKKLHYIEMWKQESRGSMRTMIGISMIALAWLLIMISIANTPACLRCGGSPLHRSAMRQNASACKPLKRSSSSVMPWRTAMRHVASSLNRPFETVSRST